MERKPEWLKIKVNAEHKDVSKLLRKNNLHTVCEEAFCPNRMECFAKKTATFMILGDVCTRNCRYCNVTSGNPKPVVDDSENILETINKLGLKYVVVTSVTRDDLKDGGASQFVKVIEKVKDKDCKIEVLIPDFLGDLSALKKVVMSKPDVLNHNIETTKNIFSSVRPKGDYNQSLELIKRVKEIDPNMTTKSGFMVGLGESYEDVVETLKDLRSVNCDIVTIGQYLQPSKDNIEVAEYIHIDKFEEFKKIGLELGFKNVYSGPFVRSSYNAEEIYEGEDI
ncbi:lipoyl synthase [Mycoplasmatota bacterium]|nr:lipoyl synthase [Mycoplasmatota bacterium]